MLKQIHRWIGSGLLICDLLLLGALNGFAQRADTSSSAHQQIKATSFILPAAFIGYGLVSLAGKNPVRSLDLTTKDELQEDHPLFAAHADNYLQFAPAAVVFGMQLAGVRAKHKLADAAGIYLLSMTMMTGSVTALKHITARERPDHSVFNSFPSGHTATVFASAEFLNQEYGDRYPWLACTGYAVATATAALRMYNNRHWLSDVVAGAGFGLLSTKAAYLLYPGFKRAIFGKNSSAFNMIPYHQNGGTGIYFSGNF